MNTKTTNLEDPLLRLTGDRSGIDVCCPAKINLNLHVLNRREDDYHNISSIMVKVALFDQLRITLTDSPGIHLTCPNHSELENNDNLVFRVAKKMLPPEAGVNIELKKFIPVGAGLGGGSSDAGGTIRGLNALLNLQLPAADLINIASDLGADIPFFLANTSWALATGTGTQIMPIHQTPKLHLVICFPGFGISTPWAYETLRQKRQYNADSIKIRTTNRNQVGFSPESSWSGAHGITDIMDNDFEPIVAAEKPSIHELITCLHRQGALRAMMSGSGASVFGLFQTADEAKEAASALIADPPIEGLWVQASESL